jgi:hypothetical protein
MKIYIKGENTLPVQELHLELVRFGDVISLVATDASGNRWWLLSISNSGSVDLFPGLGTTGLDTKAGYLRAYREGVELT